ncbi:MAG: hypothetical protein AAB798_01785 [Patescibacteria group bacterium]
MNVSERAGGSGLPARSAQAGISILGALVFALALGTTAITGFELASTPPSSAFLAQSGSTWNDVKGRLMKPLAPSASPDTAKTPTCAFACSQKGDAKEGDILKQSCEPGFDYTIKETNGTVTVDVTAQNKISESECPVPAKTTVTAASSAKIKKECAKGEKKIYGMVSPRDTGRVEYCTKVTLKDNAGRGKNEEKCSKKAECAKDKSSNVGDVAQKLDLKNKSVAELLASLPPAGQKQALAKLNPNGEASEGISNAIKELSGEKEQRIAKNESSIGAIEEALKDCAAGSCRPGEEEKLNAEKRKLEAENVALANQMKGLASAQKSLASVAAKGPPGRSGDPPPSDPPPDMKGAVVCKGLDCRDADGNPVPPPGGGGGFPGGGGGQQGGGGRQGGGGGGRQGGGGGQPRGGGGQRQGTFPQQQQQQCSTQYICNGNAIYIQQIGCQQSFGQQFNQQQSQPQFYQQCQFGCQQGSNTCSQTQQCLPPPQQPDPSQCTSGTWKPKYGGQSGTCMVGWECTPSGGPSPDVGAPKAQLSCQPKVADVGMELLLTFSCSAGTSSGSGFNTNGAQSGSATAVLSAPIGGTNTANFGLTCTKEGRSGSTQCSVQVGKPGIVLVANPKSVKSGKTSALGWVTAGMQSCIISSPNLPEFTSQNASQTSVNGTATTPPLSANNSATNTYNFLLNCTTLGGGTKQASTTVTATP